MSDSAASVPAFMDDPAGCFNAMATRPPGRELWRLLAGTTASCMKDEGNAQLCALYLQAVAQQLPASDMAVADAASNSNNANMEIEMMKAKMLMEVLDAVALAAAKCPRQLISRSGILQALIVHPGSKASFLTQVQVEFCQVALLAGQYRFAARCIKNQWPRPAQTISIRHVLRYFLLRGMIHVGCNDWPMAVRCFWTCLSVPSEIVSALSISAWKKLVLVQCLQMEDDDYRAAQDYQMQQQQQQQQQWQQMMAQTFDPFSSFGSAQSSATGGNNGQRGPLSLPKAVPNCISRFLTTASNNSNKQQRAQQQQKQQKQQQPEDVGIMVAEEEMSEQQRQQGYTSLGVKVYMDLVYAFVAGDRDKFLALQTQHTALLQNDGNFGLVRQCETAMVHRQVYQLSRMFSVIALTDLAAKLQMDVDPTKALLQQLSLEKTIHPSSSATKWPDIEIEDDGMVVFDFSAPAAPDDDPISGMLMADGQAQSELENNIMQLVKLTHDVEKLDVSIATSPMYHALVRRAQDAKMGGPRGVEEL
ncbi:expressed unknown protein [Seminavis robusta]|uniref:COP9 signalosome complex subunit 3 n=1 Tax=Seminavis robusta TaxID=568900 RepID=A0A9N8DF94_9STRA|nr:expressed unknown protein [Seminavis robusta]|eukprot:Sro61_g034980.1 n/a (532) ;mRNA; f:56723-58519